mgnify:CR=1 FL=1
MPRNKTIFMASGSDGKFSAIGGWWTVLAFIAAFLGGASLRLMEAGKWAGEALSIAGEKLMATHDAYAFLAGAKGTSRFANDPLSGLLETLSAVTGLSLGTVGFWLPAFMAPLAALPVCLVAGRLRSPEAGLTAGTLTVIAGGFLLRSRIGYLDTDVYSLFFAVGAASGMFLWLYAVCRRGLLPAWDDPSSEELSVPGFWLWAMVLGLFLWLYMLAYPSGRPIIWSIIAVGSVAGLFFARTGSRMPLVVGLAIIISIWQYRFYGLAGSAAIIALGAFDMRLLTRRRVGLAAASAFLAYFLVMKGFGELKFIGQLTGEYLKFGAARDEAMTGTTPVQLPSVMQSVREAANVATLQDVKEILSGNWAVFIAGLAGTLLMVIRYPLLVVFLPLLGLALASVRFGMRFTMYGGPVLGLGIGLAVSEFMRIRGQSEVRRWAAQIVITVGILFTFIGVLRELPAVPVLPRQYAETFVDIGKISEEEAVLWQWWDYGYAAQYYAERETYGDGGRQSGEYLYPLGLIHTTTSPLQAANVIRFMAAEREKMIRERREQGDKPEIDAVLKLYSIDPFRDIKARDPFEMQSFVKGLAYEEYDPDIEIPEQYYVLSWENLNLASWIFRFGSWDLAAGQQKSGRFSLLRPNTQFNMKRGVMRSDDGTAPLSGMILIMENGERKRYSWPNMTGIYVIANRATGQLFVMQEKLFNSMLVQMLLGDPTRFSEEFEMVVDRAPWARAYRVR